MDFYTIESQDAVRMSWNVLPPTKLSLTTSQIPLGCIYTPMKGLKGLVQAEYKPLSCSKCQAVLNPYCKVDFKAKLWLCPFCLGRNAFPSEYADQITESNLPAELVPEHTSIEFTFSDYNPPASIYMFLIDTCVPPEELQAIKDAILQAVSLMPPETWVGLVSFGRFAFVHELSAVDCPRSYAFEGEKEYSTAQVLELLGLAGKNDPRGLQVTGAIKKFILPISDCENMFISVVESLQPDPWEVPIGERPVRCTGTAMSISVSILEAAYPGQGSRVLSFIGGPCTHGPGQVVGVKLEEPIRSWIDIEKNNEMCKYIKKATKYYQSITERAIKTGQAIDIFAFTLDQFGLLEMRSLNEKTGGISVTHEMFDAQVFKDTFKKIFDRDANGDLRFGFCGDISINLSNKLRICGAIGPCTSLKKQTPLQSELEIGESGTSQWHLGGLDKNSTVAFYLDLSSNLRETVTQEKMGYIQFRTNYRHSRGSYRLRVTTIARRFATDSDNLNQELAQGFDQEAACVLLSRLAFVRVEPEPISEVVRWIDSTVAGLSAKFGEKNKEDVAVVKLPREFCHVQPFTIRLKNCLANPMDDDNVCGRVTFCRETTLNSLIMLQPSVLMYSFDSPEPIPVLRDVAHLKNDVILMLDGFFSILVWKGDHICKWEKAGYQNNPEYENFKKLLEAPYEDAELIIQDRYPTPMLRTIYPGHFSEKKLRSQFKADI